MEKYGDRAFQAKETYLQRLKAEAILTCYRNRGPVWLELINNEKSNRNEIRELGKDNSQKLGFYPRGRGETLRILCKGMISGYIFRESFWGLLCEERIRDRKYLKRQKWKQGDKWKLCCNPGSR